MTLEDNKRIAQATLDMFAGRMDLSHAAEYLATNALDHQGWPGVDTQGVEGFKRIVTMFNTAFPDKTVENMPLIAEGDLVVAHFHMTGKNSGPMMGLPPTGKAVDIMGVDIIRIANGKAVEHWGYMEEGKMMQQLGLMPSPQA